ncbi:MAG: ATP-binding protein [Alphaproteobacteria bacterium]
MNRVHLNRRVFVTTFLAVFAPVATVLFVLVSISQLEPLPALAAGLAAGLALVFLVRTHLRRLERARSFAEQLASGRMPADVANTDDETDLSSSLRRLGMSWAERAAELESLVAENRIITDAVPFPLLRISQRRQVVRGNRAAHELLGDDLEDHDLSAVIRNPDVASTADRTLGTREAQQVRFDLAAPMERSFLAYLVPLEKKLSDGTVMVATLHDITDLRRAEEMRADFVANASHELRTPLTSFTGYIETLRGPARSDEAARERFLEIMYGQASRMVRLVDDLMSLSKIELLEGQRPKSAVRVENTLSNVVEFLEPEAEKLGMSIEMTIAHDDAGRSPAVIGDSDQLAQVFQNLLDNAIKYGHDDTPIEIEVAYVSDPPPGVDIRLSPPAHRAVAIAVRDHGPGIAPQHIPRLTERFYRVDQARSRSLGGTGLGLAIVKHIVSRHRGVLQVESELNKGSVFRVILPGETPL